VKTTQHDLVPEIARWRENLLDFELVVDDKRQAIDRALDELRAAVRERDRAAAHLQHLVGLASDLSPEAATRG